jgi:putative ABC transport system ATP-binding protein
MEQAIETKKLVMTYGQGRAKVEALKGIDLAVNKGELLAIMGPSGSGKTTLLMILGLVTEPTAGELILDGDNIYKAGKRDFQRLRREKIGFIFQFSNLIPFLTAEESCLIIWKLETGRVSFPKSYPGARGNAWRSPEPWPTVPR